MNKKDYEEFLRHCEVLFKVGEEKTILRVVESQQVIVRKFLSNIFPELLPTLSQQKQLSHEHLQSIIDYCQISQDAIAVFTQYSTHTLEEELKTRRKSNTRFTLEELENILVSAVKALQYLESKSVGHGCCSAKDIAISHDGTVRLVDPCLASSSPLLLTPGYFYSPELLSYNQTQNGYNGVSHALEQLDFFKNDIFSLALMIVELGLLHCNVSQCIDYNTGKFDYIVLEQYLNQFKCIFDNPPFINLLCGMLFEDPSLRLNAEGVLNFIEEQFSLSDEDEDQNLSMISSYTTSSRNEKTVCSFLLSQGPAFEQEDSIKSSKDSLLLENQGTINKTIKRALCNKGNPTGKTPLIKC